MPAEVNAVLTRSRAIRARVVAELEKATLAEIAWKPGERWSAREILIHLATNDAAGTRILGYLNRGEQPPRETPLPPDAWNARELAKHADLDASGAIGLLHRTRRDWEAAALQITPESLSAALPVIVMNPGHELGHLHQIQEVLALARGDQKAAVLSRFAYARQQMLVVLDLENLPAEALTWRPSQGGWSGKEILLHMAVWDRLLAGALEAVADGRPLPPEPFPEGQLDAWNDEQVAALAWMTVSEALHEFGAARGEAEAQLRRCTPAQLEQAGGWVNLYKHDLHHLDQMARRIWDWRKAAASW
jgi:uncharacterized damage-inducible protein DinB